MKEKIMPFYLLILLLITLTLSLFGCDSAEPSLSTNYKSGVKELQLKLLPNAPPEKIYPNSDFKLIVEADNQAGYDLREGKLIIVGSFDRYFEFPELTKELSGTEEAGVLKGRSLTIPSGEKVFIEFDGRANNLYLNAEKQDFNYFLRADYKSMMDFSDTVCINPNLYAVYDSGCKVEEKKSYSGQGAPLSITSMEEITTPGPASRVEFRLDIKNRGKGTINSVELISARLGGKDLVCEFVGNNKPIAEEEDSLGRKIVFGEKNNRQEAVLICKTILEDTSSYMTTLVLEFNYEYTLKQQNSLRLVR